jgi:hypothetical protein
LLHFLNRRAHAESVSGGSLKRIDMEVEADDTVSHFGLKGLLFDE